MKLLLGLWLIFCPLALAEEKNPALIEMEDGEAIQAPERLELESYSNWINPLLEDFESYSAFTPKVFEWYEEQLRTALPEEVYKDPGKIYVNVERPLRQTIEMEENGDIEEGNTVGAEVYAEMDGNVEQALEAMLYVWGKPVGASAGKTHPAPSPFSRRVEYFAPLPQFGEGVFANLTLRRDGGIIKDLSDRYFFLVRGNKETGFTVLMQYRRPALKTYSKQCIAIAMLQPLPNGKTAYRISTRYQGQSYKILGNIGIGRSQIGFNREKVRAVAEEYNKRIVELKTTGTIKDKKSDIEWGEK
jgi:hypothetical protein